jgi:hypothetical protein
MFDIQINVPVIQRTTMFNMRYSDRESTTIGNTKVAKKCVFKSSQLDNRAIY